MNLSISTLNFKSKQKNENNIQNQNQKFGVGSMQAQLSKDTVSFTGKSKVAKTILKNVVETADISRKKAGSRSDAITYGIARQINQDALPYETSLRRTLHKYFSPFISTEQNPDRPLTFGINKGIHTRTKKVDSIVLKTASLGVKNLKEIALSDSMADVIGGRLTFRDSSQKSVEKVIDKMIEGVKNGDLKIYEIENYTLEGVPDLVSQKMLKKLTSACESIRTNGATLKNAAIPSGYNGVHLGVYLPDGHRAEIQLLGEHVAQVKDVEDFVYKVKNKKELELKYKTIQEHLAPLRDDKSLQRAMKAYSVASYKHAKSIKPRNNGRQKISPFLPTPDYLDPKYSFAKLAEMKASCEKKWKLAGNVD